MLTFWLFLVFLIPASQVVPAVGAAGRPAVLFGYGLLMMWLATRFIPGAVYRIRQPMRWFLGIYIVAFVISYALGVSRSLLRPIPWKSSRRNGGTKRTRSSREMLCKRRWRNRMSCRPELANLMRRYMT